MITSTFLYLLFFIRISHALNNGLGKTPQMGKRVISCAHTFIIYSFKDGTVGIIFIVTSMKN